MGLKNRSFTDEQFIEAIKISYSIAGTLRKLSLNAFGANYKMFKILSKKLNADCSHFTGQGHLKGKTHSWCKKIPLERILVKNSSYNSCKLKKRLIEKGLLENKCSVCNILHWQGQKLSLHMDHINGDSLDNRLDNLRVLCPNCHSQTPTYCGRNKKKKKLKLKKLVQNKKCIDCDINISRYKAVRCKSCAGKHIQLTKIEWPLIDKLIEMVNQASYVSVGKQLGVSDNAVRKHIKRHS